MLMVGTILGPGTIFLMMIGAINAITQISNFNALMLNLVPILFFIIICMTCKSETQVPFLLIIFFIFFYQCNGLHSGHLCKKMSARNDMLHV